MNIEKPRIKVKKINGEEVIEKNFIKGDVWFKKSRYEKEKSLYLQFKNKNIKTPKLVKYSDSEKKLYIKKIDPSKKNKEDEKKIVEKLLEFQFSNAVPKESVFLKILDNPSFRLIRNATLSIKILKPRLYFKILKELFLYIFFSPKLPRKVLIHNDFHKENIIKDSNEFYFIDLESAIHSKKWLFKDIVHQSFSREKVSYDPSLVNLYKEQLKKKHPGIYKKLDIQKEIKITKIKFCLKKKKEDLIKDYLILIKKEFQK